MSGITLDALAQEMRQRLDAIGEDVSNKMSDVQLRAIVEPIVKELFSAPDGAEWLRKLSFGQENNSALVGTKYSRWNLGVADIEFLYELQGSLAGQKRVGNVGVYGGGLLRTFGGTDEDLRGHHRVLLSSDGRGSEARS